MKNTKRRLKFRHVPGPTQYRVWNIVNPPNSPDYYYVNTPAEAHTLTNGLANAQLKNPAVHSNAFGFEVNKDGEWEEWYDDEGRDLDEAFERLKVTDL
jgi:hypothetical protein